MQTHLNPDRFQEQKWGVATSIANLRSIEPPTYNAGTASSQTYSVILLLGSVSPFAGNAGVYVWDAASVAADNNSTIIKPDGYQVGGNPGRWRGISL